MKKIKLAICLVGMFIVFVGLILLLREKGEDRKYEIRVGGQAGGDVFFCNGYEAYGERLELYDCLGHSEPVVITHPSNIRITEKSK